MNKLYDEDSIAAIGAAIRDKNNTNNTYTVAQMAPAILDLEYGTYTIQTVTAAEYAALNEYTHNCFYVIPK